MVASAKDYNAIAKKKIVKPSQMGSLYNILIYSRSKKGKSWLAESANELAPTLILDPELGTKAMKEKDPDVWPITAWPDVNDFYGFLRKGDHEYGWAVVDGCTKIYNKALRFICRVREERELDSRPGQVTKRDYGDANELFKDFVEKMVNLPMGVIFTTQERQRSTVGFDEDADEEEVENTVLVPDLPAGASNYILGEVDVIGRLYVQRVQSNDATRDERRLYLSPSSTRYSTGYRSEFTLPDTLRNPTIARLVRLIDTGKATTPRSK